MSSETLSLMINKIFVTGFGYDPNKKVGTPTDETTDVILYSKWELHD